MPRKKNLSGCNFCFSVGFEISISFKCIGVKTLRLGFGNYKYDVNISQPLDPILWKISASINTMMEFKACDHFSANKLFIGSSPGHVAQLLNRRFRTRFESMDQLAHFWTRSSTYARINVTHFFITRPSPKGNGFDSPKSLWNNLSSFARHVWRLPKMKTICYFGCRCKCLKWSSCSA